MSIDLAKKTKTKYDGDLFVRVVLHGERISGWAVFECAQEARLVRSCRDRLNKKESVCVQKLFSLVLYAWFKWT